jgi:uncharacterized membrane protein YccC
MCLIHTAEQYQAEVKAIRFEKEAALQMCDQLWRQQMRAMQAKHETQIKSLEAKARAERARLTKQLQDVKAMQGQLMAGVETSVKRVRTLRAQVQALEAEKASLLAASSPSSIKKADAEVDQINAPGTSAPEPATREADEAEVRKEETADSAEEHPEDCTCSECV